MDSLNLVLEKNLLPLLFDILKYAVANWGVIVTFLGIGAIILVVSYLAITELPKLLKSIMTFVETATTNIPLLTNGINNLINNVEKMNATLTALLAIQARVDRLEDKVLGKLDEVMTKASEMHSTINLIASRK